MKRASVYAMVAVLAGLMGVSVACEFNLAVPPSGRLTLSIGCPNARTLGPEGVSLAMDRLVVEGTGPDSATITLDDLVPGTASVTINDLAAGAWAFAVSAYNVEGVLLGQGRSQATVVSEANVTVAITVYPLSGQGKLALGMDWPMSEVASPSVAARLATTDGTNSERTLSFTMGTGNAAFQDDVVEAGTYILLLQLKDGGDIVWGTAASVVVMKDKTTRGTYSLTDEMLNLLPEGPTGLALASATAAGITLGWADNSAVEEGYRVERKLGSEAYAQVGSDLPENTAAFTDSTAILGIIYTYRVRAFNTWGSSPYSNETLGIIGPWEPQEPAGENGIAIVWKGSFPSAPSDPRLNWAYYDSSLGKAYIWDGYAWRIMAQDGSVGDQNGAPIMWKGVLAAAPLNPQLNWAYYDSSAGKAFIWDGLAWQALAQEAQRAVYRWTLFDTTSGENGGEIWEGVSDGFWTFGNSAMYTGGISPRDWAKCSAEAGDINPDADSLRSTFTNMGYATSNALIAHQNYARPNWCADWSDATYIAMAFIRVRNDTALPVDWNFGFCYSSHSSCGHRASLSIDGATVWRSDSDIVFASASVPLAIPADSTSTVIVVAPSFYVAAPANYLGSQSLTLGLLDNCLKLPPGLSIVDDLDSATGDLWPPAQTPQAPQGVAVSSTSDSSISLSWNAVPDAQRYHVHRSASINGQFLRIGDPTEPSFTDAGLPKATKYFYRITASSKYAIGDYSDIIETFTWYTVYYDGNGADGGAIPGGMACHTGSTVTVSNNVGMLSRTGYAFSGWNTQADGSGTTYAAGTGTFPMPAYDVVLYAKWRHTPAVIYGGNGNDVGGVPGSTCHEIGSTVIVSGNVGGLGKTGYAFAGWNTQADGNGGNYEAGTGTLTMPADDVALYAKWRYTPAVVYNGNGNDGGGVPGSVYHEIGSMVVVSSNVGNLTRIDYEFSGWNTQADGNGTLYAPGSGSFPMPDHSIVLYAIWSPHEYFLGNAGPAGGFIFYYNKNHATDGWTYLEAAPYDQSTGIQWYKDDYILVGAIGAVIGSGKWNSSMIVAAQGEGSYAAKICDDLVLGGYDDWFLPSIGELNQVYINLMLKGKGSFPAGGAYYWSSSEDSKNQAWEQYFFRRMSGLMELNMKECNNYVRAVRYF